MKHQKINKLIKKGKLKEATEDFVAAVRGDFEDAGLIAVFERLALASFPAAAASRQQIIPGLLCHFVDKLISARRLSDAVPLAGFIYHHFRTEPPANRLMAIMYERLGDNKQAELYCHRLLKLDPENVNNYVYFGRLKRMNRDMQGALDVFNHGLGLNAQHEQLLTELGILLFDVGSYDQAVDVYAKLYDAYPENLMAAANLVISQIAIGQIDEACQVCRKADTHLMGNGYYLDAKAKLLLELGEIKEALSCAERAVKITPEKESFKATLSHIYLMSGRLREGFEFYKYRFAKDMIGGVMMDDIKLPLLTHKDQIAGKHIYIRAEQGLGDTLNFCTLIPFVLAAGGQVSFAVQAQLADILKPYLKGVNILTDKTVPEDADMHCPLIDLAALFRIGSESLPLAQSYLASEKDYRDKWAQILGPSTKCRIGLTWSGGTATRHDRKRTIPLEAFLSALPEGPDYISLQKEIRSADQATLKAHPEIRHFGDKLADFRDTAALVDAVDLIVCVDTSIVHLAGAMGRPAWLLLPARPDFRWLLEGNRTDWYPSLTLYRNTETDDWTALLHQIHTDLAAFCKAEAMSCAG